MESFQRKAIVDICRTLYERDLLAACDGNVSVKLDDDHFLITPSGVHKGFLQPDQMVVMKMSGEVLCGTPSSEWRLHHAIYQNCPKANAVIHAHPPTAVGWTLANPEAEELPSKNLPEVILAMGRVRVASYKPPGGDVIAEGVIPFLPKARAILLARHGSLVWGETLEEAFFGTERIEHTAKMLLSAHSFGGAQPLSENQLNDLFEIRKQLGDALR